MSAEIRTVQDFIRNLLSATANASLYSPSHPQVAKLTDAAFSIISQVLADLPEITIVVIEGELVINGQPQEYSLFLNRFADILKTRGISHLQITSGLSRDEIGALISGLAHPEGTAAATSSSHVTLGQVAVHLGTGSGPDHCADSETGRAALAIPDLPQEELARFTEIYEAAKSHKKLKITGMFDIVSGFINAFRQEGDSMLAVASLRNTDEYTFTHSTNVCILNIAQAMALGIEGQLLHDIGIAAMLHDIGKLFIPEEILTKKDKLTAAEFEIMKQHPSLGAKHLLDTPGVPRLAISTAYEHHLKYNLSGYPKVQAGWQPDLCSQMTMISDFFDALRTRRSYREPIELRQIARMMWNMMGNDLHPVLTRNFLQILSRLTKS